MTGAGVPGGASTHLRFGPDAALPAGYARLEAGARLERGHAAGRAPDFFGPPVGLPGRNRFDGSGPRRASEPGTCYLALGMLGVLQERVLRGVRLPLLSRARLSAAHHWSVATSLAPLLLLDLWLAPTVHGLELAEISAPPRRVPRPPPSAAFAVHADGRPVVPYPPTQQLADAWRARNASGGFPVPGGRVDGILYGSRFGPASLCVALWEPAAGALRWSPPLPLGEAPGLAAAANLLGVGLAP